MSLSWLVARRPARSIVVAFAVAAAIPAAPEAAAAQRGPVPLLPPDSEAVLARSAAEPAISGAADVWVLTRSGYRLHAGGTNRWTCLVERDHPKSLAPICYDPEGTRALVPGVRRIEELRSAGMAYVEAVDSVEALYRNGALDAPTRPVLTYMISPRQRLYATPTGPAIGAWRPHVMIFDPSLSADALSLPEDASAMVNHLGRIFNYLIIPVGDFAGR